ncbi:class I SAM-dependent methyltransferase [Streptomyces sp. TRM 70361]|uniref:class I SAM-dependent methyltransferase n=1 Tax=Streptomyces sp. TRM 70361 TaxID=3116553 RepID=UPI002E7B438A|nr:class I SAM-dependent methyltransferase [Streptomyces sp. TRM 70361]MEE1941907.1 class I SAM-dependent methyltransferase [Streptomyces sp. TRM 70361]
MAADPGTDPEPWMIDESAYAGPEHLDAAFVAGFDRKQGHPDPGPDLAALRRHGVGEDATVVDLGAGTGRFALAAAREFARVVAVDVSPAMLAHLRERAAAARAGNVECVRAGFLTYRHPGPPADAVHTRHALHQLPDLFKAVALARIAALLRPGGVLRLRDLVLDCPPAGTGAVVARWLAGAADDPERGYTRADYTEHLRTEYSTFRWLLEPMLDQAGFEIVEAEYEGRLFGTYTCLRRP